MDSARIIVHQVRDLRMRCALRLDGVRGAPYDERGGQVATDQPFVLGRARTNRPQSMSRRSPRPLFSLTTTLRFSRVLTRAGAGTAAVVQHMGTAVGEQHDVARRQLVGWSSIRVFDHGVAAEDHVIRHLAGRRRLVDDAPGRAVQAPQLQLAGDRNHAEEGD
jgi:hypothetical protein